VVALRDAEPTLDAQSKSMSDQAKPHIPELYVEQFALGELPSGRRRAELEAAVQGGSELIAKLQRSNAQLLAEHPPAAMAAAIERRLRNAEVAHTARRRGWLLPGLAVGVACAAAALALFVFWPSAPQGTPESQEPLASAPADSAPEITRDKGLTPQITIHRKTAEASEKLTNGQRASEHDLLQLGYIAAGRPYGVLLSVDGARVVTLHFPATPQSSTLLERSGEVYLPTAYELDAAPRFEQFFFVTSASELDVPAVVDLAQRWADSNTAGAWLSLPESLEQTNFRLLKEPR